MKNIEIASVKLREDGTKGADITYKEVGPNQDREFIDAVTRKKKAPIHKELEDCFSWLKGHVLDICGYGELSEEDYDLAKTYTDVTGITYGEKGFIITAKMSVLDRTKVVSINTPLITSEEDYDQFHACCKIMDGIYSETKEYMGNKKIMTDEQLIVKFNKKNEDFDQEAVKAMTPAEKKAEATRILEDMGSIVIHNDEMEEDTSEEIHAEVVNTLAPKTPKPVKAITPKVIAPEPVQETEVDPFADYTEEEETDESDLAVIPDVPVAPKSKKITPADVKAMEADDDFSLVPLLTKTK